MGQKKQLTLIKLFLRAYCYSTAQGRFVAVPAMPMHLPHQVSGALRALHAIDQGVPASQKAQPALSMFAAITSNLWRKQLALLLLQSVNVPSLSEHRFLWSGISDLFTAENVSDQSTDELHCCSDKQVASGLERQISV